MEDQRWWYELARRWDGGFVLHRPTGGFGGATGAYLLHYSVPRRAIYITGRDPDQRLWIDGEGIPAEDLPYIFDRFWRGDPSRPHGGSAGLGLAIAQQLVRAHDGRIDVVSQVGQGTIFTIELPAGTRSH